MPLTHRNGPTEKHRTGMVDNGRMRNMFTGGIDQKNGIPSGHLPPSSWVMPQKGGGMSAFTNVQIVVSAAPLVLAGGVNLEGTASITFTVPDALLQLIADLAGTGTITFTVPSAALGGAAGISGTTTITFSVPDAILGGVANLVATTTVVVGASAVIRADGFMSGPAEDASVTPANVADAVWSNIVASGYTAADIMELLAAVAAGKTDISNLGGGASIVTFRNVADDRDAVVAGMVGSKRDTVTLDIT